MNDYNELTNEELIILINELEQEKKEALEVISELKSSQEQNSKTIKTLKEQINTRNRVLKKLATKEALIKYINSDEVMVIIATIFKNTQDTLHKGTFKNLITKSNSLQYENALHEKLTNKNLKKTTSTKTLNKKLKELECLKLINIPEDDYIIRITDKMANLIKSNKTKYQKENGVRAIESTKDEKELIVITEDKGAVARLRTNRKIIKTEEHYKWERYKNIYKINHNSFLIGRKISESEESFKSRIDLVMDELKIKENMYIKNDIPIYMVRKGDYYAIKHNKNFSKLTVDEKCLELIKEHLFHKDVSLYKQDLTLDEQAELSKTANYVELRQQEKIIYIHEDTSKNIMDYINRRIEGYDLQYFRVIKYTT